MDNKISELKNFFIKLRGQNIFGRLGKTFTADEDLYFLDTGTGKIAKISENVYLILKCLFETDSFDNIFDLNLSKEDVINALNEIKVSVENDHILSAKPLTTLTGQALYALESQLNNELAHLTLEVTQKCNLRCRYCIYHQYQTHYRNFEQKDMNWDIAKQAIDFFNEHSKAKKEVYISFYGGEPLLNFPIIKNSVEYANKVINDGREIHYSITTNATLLTKEISSFLAHHDFNVSVSLDGSKDIHDENRITVNGEGSFEATLCGIKTYLDICKSLDIKPILGFNMVTSGSNYFEKYDQIQKFFDSLDWLPENVNITSSLPGYAHTESKYVLPQSNEEKAILKNKSVPLRDWSKNILKENYINLFSEGMLTKDLLIIHKRLLLDKPSKGYGMNGCCVPGQRRVYVDVDGNLLVCERVGNAPNIGNVYSGFDIEKIKKHYVHDFINEAKKYCKNCWAVNLCTLCYVDCYDSNGIHYSYRHNACVSYRKELEEALSWYHYLLKNKPEKLEVLNSITIK